MQLSAEQHKALSNLLIQYYNQTIIQQIQENAAKGSTSKQLCQLLKSQLNVSVTTKFQQTKGSLFAIINKCGNQHMSETVMNQLFARYLRQPVDTQKLSQSPDQYIQITLSNICQNLQNNMTPQIYSQMVKKPDSVNQFVSQVIQGIQEHFDSTGDQKKIKRLQDALLKTRNVISKLQAQMAAKDDLIKELRNKPSQTIKTKPPVETDETLSFDEQVVDGISSSSNSAKQSLQIVLDDDDVDDHLLNL